VATRLAWNVAEEKISSPAAKAATTDHQREAMEEQCECLVHEFTLLSLRGFELCITITGALPLPPAQGNAHCGGPAHRGGHAVIRALGGGLPVHLVHSRDLPIDVSQEGVVGEMVVPFWKRAEWCSRLEAYCLEVCDLVLGPMEGQAHLVVHLEEAIGRLQAM
jgi:hypothetical protein